MSEQAEQRTTLSQRLGAWAYLTFCGVLRCLDIRVIAIFGRCLGYLVWALMPSRRKIVARNIRIAVNPALKGAELSSLVRRNIVRTTMNMACTFKTGLMTDKELNRSVTLIGAEEFEKLTSNGQCIIGCIPHAGNWEILARIRPLFPTVKRFGSMYRRLDNPLLEDIVYKSRTRFGCEMFSNKKGLKEVFRLSKEGGMLGVLSDQFTQQGVFLPYFGKVTGTTPLPALLYKRCKGKGHLVAVTTSNTGLGKWNAILNREVEIAAKENADITEITQAVNQALAEIQKESILDGFWMHHRWKPTGVFAPDTNDVQQELIRQYCTLPFRIIVCLPEEFEEAILTIPFMKELVNRRQDIQVQVICSPEQQAFWKTQKYITYVVTTENPLSQLESDELYKDGPYDYLFMLSDNKKVFNNLKPLMPLYISGFASSPLRKKLRTKCNIPVGEQPIHRMQHYEELLSYHSIQLTQEFADVSSGNSQATGNFIAPYSTLGAADSWQPEKWKELITRLNGNVTLLALEQDKEKAYAMAEEAGIPCTIVKPETVADVLGSQCHLFAMDGLLPQLAALTGCRCTVIMASRLPAVYAPPGDGHTVLYNHVPCHPCYHKACDQKVHCTADITVDELLK